MLRARLSIFWGRAAVPWPMCRQFQATAFCGQHGDLLHRRHTSDTHTPCICHRTSTPVHWHGRHSKPVDWRHPPLCHHPQPSECSVEPGFRGAGETCRGMQCSRQRYTEHRTTQPCTSAQQPRHTGHTHRRRSCRGLRQQNNDGWHHHGCRLPNVKGTSFDDAPSRTVPQCFPEPSSLARQGFYPDQCWGVYGMLGIQNHLSKYTEQTAHGQIHFLQPSIQQTLNVLWLKVLKWYTVPCATFLVDNDRILSRQLSSLQHDVHSWIVKKGCAK